MQYRTILMAVALLALWTSAIAADKEPSEEEKTRAVAAMTKEIADLKPGMTRADLIKVVATEGGISSASQRTYVSKTTPNVKINVTFKPTRDTTGTAVERDDDVILEISKPYWALPVRD